MNHIVFRFSHVLFLAMLAATAGAQWSLSPATNNVICNTTDEQYLTAMTSDGSGGAILAWYETRGVCVQRINHDGVVTWSANGVLIAQAGDIEPAIVSDGNGGAIVAWYSFRNSANLTSDIYAQRINGTGVPQWTANGVLIARAIDRQLSSPIILSMASDGAGGAILVWQKKDITGFYDIHAQRVNGAGGLMWDTSDVVVSAASGHQQLPRLVSDGAEGAIVTWSDQRSGFDVLAQRINKAGVPLWTADGVPLCLLGSSQLYPKIATDGAGGAIVSWDDYRSNTAFDIYAQRIDAAGAVQWTTNGVPLCSGAGDQYYNNITDDNAGGAIVTWMDNRSVQYLHVYAQRINHAGVVQWMYNGTPITTAPNQQYDTAPIIVSDNAGGAIIAWHDARSGFGIDIYAQRVNNAGDVQWMPNGVAVSTAGGPQVLPVIVSDPSGGGIVAWGDLRNGNDNHDIYAQNVDKFGYFGINTPNLTSVRDVTGDQGGKVTVAWNRADLDASPHQAVTYYSLWRGIDGGALSPTASFISPEAMTIQTPVRTVRKVVTSAATTYWELLGTSAGHYFPSYSFTAPTLSDSNKSGIPSFKFLVSAHTANQFIFWDSNVDSGYSVDNLAPLSVAGLAGEIEAGPSVRLHWSRNMTDPDVREYEVHRSTNAVFVPSPATRLGSTPDTTFIDVTPAAMNYYRIVTLDAHDNGSIPSLPVSVRLTGVEDALSLPTVYALDQNYPNPFNPATAVSYQLSAASKTKISIYDVLGREVAVLVNEPKSPGSHTVSWDASGMASGVYYCRLQAGEFTQTRKLLLVR